MIKLKNLLEKNLISESIYDKGLFKAIFFAGIPGSGKSYVLSKIVDGTIQPRIVNTDKFIEYISNQVGMDINVGIMYNLYKDKVKTLTKNQFALYVNGMLPLFIDGTSNSAKNIFKRDGILKSFGYDTGMVWIETNVDQAIERAKKRSREVPEDFIREVHYNLQKNKSYYKSHFKFFHEILNSEGELTDSAILDSYKAVRGFFTSPIENPLGELNLEKAKSSNGYLVPSVYKTISEIQQQLTGWYSN